MNQTRRSCVLDIDALLQNTGLQVISLRHGPQFQDGGRVLWGAALPMWNACSVN